MRFIGSSGRAFLLILSLLSITPGLAYSAEPDAGKTKPGTAVPENSFSAVLMEIEGIVVVIDKKTNAEVAAVEGEKVKSGYLVRTKADAAVDILYEDGNVTALDENTTIEIKNHSLEKGEMTSIVELTKGRIRNSVTKAMNIRTKFEVHTRSGVAGVTGTPPWLVTLVTGPDGTETAEVDLLTKSGDTGGVFFKGTDKDASQVNLKPGTRTTAVKGTPPAPPRTIEPERLTMLEKAAPIRVKPEIRQQKRKSFLEKVAAIMGAEKAKEKKPEPKPEPIAEPKQPLKEEPKVEEKPKAMPVPVETVKEKPKAKEEPKEKAVKKKKKSKKKKKKKAKKKKKDDMHDMFKRSRKKIDDSF